MKLSCYYCGSGAVESTKLPCPCPMCHHPLTKPFDEMTPQEQSAAEHRKALLDGTVSYRLAE